MKVKCLNSSSQKTRKLIKNTFAKLINEKKDLTKITVKELVNEAGITRSTFYTHYANLDEVTKDYQLETIELLCSDNLILKNKEDILVYFSNMINCLKENENTYKLLIVTNESFIFLDKLKRIASEKISVALKNTSNATYLDLDISFFMDGICAEIIRYFRGYSAYTLDDLLLNIIKWFNKLF